MPLIDDETKKALKEKFDEKMKEDVEVIGIIDPNGEYKDFSEFTENLLKELSEITPKIKVKIDTIDSDLAKKYNVERAPSVLIHPEKYNIRYTGAPAGEEGWGFIETIIMASTGESGLSDKVKEGLKELEEKRHIQVYVTPTCPYCPMAVVLANKFAIEKPDLISSECVEAMENPDLANKFRVSAVPHQVINEKTVSVGVQPETEFLKQVLNP